MRTAQLFKHMRRMNALSPKGGRPRRRTVEEVKADPRMRKAVREITKEFGGTPTTKA